MREITVAATQMACTDDEGANVARAERLVREAVDKGAQIILLQELFAGPYFCQDELPEHFGRARPIDGHPVIEHFRAIASELGVVLPISVFERANNAFFNAIAVLDAGGAVLGTYRKSHIPQGSGYQEKYYFSPGDTGFRVFDTRFGKVGVAICWDQWFPECARAMALMGAEILLYPTAIGTELLDPAYDSAPHWQTVMQGHAAANLMPLVASNRVGTEKGRNGTELTFYGSSFIAGWQGRKMAEADRKSEGVITTRFDLDEIAANRAAWGIFRDRRPDLYGTLTTLDGVMQR